MFTPPLDHRRRRMLQALVLSPLWFPLISHSNVPPDLRRIISLEWRPTELLLALGVVPLAVADIPNYHRWVAEPALPSTVIDVGHRIEPNIELMQQLNPSLFLLSKGFGPSAASLSVLAPTMSFSFNDGSGKPLETARQAVRDLAERLGLQAQAQRHLQEFDTLLSETASRVRGEAKEPVLLFSLIDSRRALVMGKGSLFDDVLRMMQIENAWQGETNFWGSSVVGIERLAEIPHARALYFDHGDQLLNVAVRSPLWQVIPFVRENKLQTLPAVWFYGATLSTMRFCRLLEQALGRGQ
ncbi:Fe(3+)-hydroxamate ABC transporter substrate-binding protein FhuD [Edaphovirga cremea]|uniref:Fe(3+)-hydroxamate ABC transporter substrate-binding protein FhuD n=1 Tax=Edaphovirga cremea TaxID=2267246 RepID=UPI000DEFD411|nr:Fe(3+)-hydroxamate ABC transporter substrate-binding protein FhuD [Edaphovirga cremea]